MESYFTVMYNKGVNHGISQGITQGITQGKELDRTEVNDLIRWLREQGREEDVWHSIDDREYQDQLIEEMHAAKRDLVDA